MNETIQALAEKLSELPESVQEKLLTLAEGAVIAVESIESKKSA